MSAKLSARSLITDLLFAKPSMAVSSKQFLITAQLFDISHNSVRVALTRLAAEGMIEVVERGVYQLTAHSKKISEPIAHRANALQHTRAWTGSYLAVHTGELNRVDRTALNRRERTLHLNGFRALQSNLYIRPDNLTESAQDTFARLVNTGLDASSAMFHASQFNPPLANDIANLWDTQLLNRRYKKTSQTIQQWLAQHQQLTLDAAARDSLLIGRQAIPLLLTDPLLPEPFINAQLQTQFCQDVLELNRVGHALWQQYYQTVLQPDNTD